MIVVVATTGSRLREVGARLDELGVREVRVDVADPGGERRLALGAVEDDERAARIVALLRADGYPAVARAEDGPRLAAWRRHTQPVEIGDRLSVCFVWSEHARVGLKNVIELDPGGGFGSGDHPTTRLLLEILADRITGEEGVLDVGCGSGVLGIAALRLGASRSTGVDIDRRAVDATMRNARLNGFGLRAEATASPLTEIEGSFDVVVANIGWTALVDLAPGVVALTAPRGWVALSGIAQAHVSLVATAFAPLRLVEERRSGEWSAIVLAR